MPFGCRLFCARLGVSPEFLPFQGYFFGTFSRFFAPSGRLFVGGIATFVVVFGMFFSTSPLKSSTATPKKADFFLHTHQNLLQVFYS